MIGIQGKSCHKTFRKMVIQIKQKWEIAMRFVLSLVLMLSFVGCALSANSGNLDYKTPETTITPEFGYLKIFTYSYPKERLSFSPESQEPERMVYAPYKIYTSDGTLVKEILSSEITPAKVKLPAGEYVIVAKMSKDKVSSFTVNIKPGQIMEVDATMLENALSKSD